MKTAYLFPGQGSQFVGMGKDLYDRYSEARDLFDEADRILGFDLKRICFEGPEEELRETRNTQPAIFVHSLAALRVLGWEIGGDEACLAGHSLGEYTAYVAAGSLGFEDGLRLVRRRGELMYQAGVDRPGAMAAILGAGSKTVEEVLARVSGTVVAANLNSPGQIVISGEVEAVERAMEQIKEAGAKKVIRLVVGGAFHSPLMEAAAAGLAERLQETSIATARGAVIANESAQAVTEPDEIRGSLGRQLLSPVRWEQTVRFMLEWGAERFVEIGPGKVLCGLVRAQERRAPTEPLGTAEQIEAVRAETGGRV